MRERCHVFVNSFLFQKEYVMSQISSRGICTAPLTLCCSKTISMHRIQNMIPSISSNFSLAIQSQATSSFSPSLAAGSLLRACLHLIYTHIFSHHCTKPGDVWLDVFCASVCCLVRSACVTIINLQLCECVFVFQHVHLWASVSVRVCIHALMCVCEPMLGLLIKSTLRPV